MTYSPDKETKTMRTSYQITDEELVEFLQNSNWIEKEYSPQALLDAMQAWDYIMNLDAISIEDILETHRRLMVNIEPRIAGNFRDDKVFVGGREGSPHYALPELIELWAIAVNEDMNANRMDEQRAKDLHVRFEKIHPFFDGNGRTGRILMNWMLIKANKKPIIIHEGEEQYEYYKWFN